MRIDPTFRRSVYQVAEQRYDPLGEWLTTDLGTFFLVSWRPWTRWRWPTTWSPDAIYACAALASDARA
ncbi:hypothetical protein Ade02nite_87770 [Paractinoplanes deccanensis]|uniref:Uncharacterized protein n=1 Tax=Paractinoplanes deccanensis TaxID=113561 RepID=A0ABQ3YJG2_9ACTN|nr:hypothetical protein [Actinoplanes deccanensis]GID80136.1 hypothetical protein Ade02nite_87770 [Actinoplanes deccanensis]